MLLSVSRRAFAPDLLPSPRTTPPWIDTRPTSSSRKGWAVGGASGGSLLHLTAQAAAMPIVPGTTTHRVIAVSVWARWSNGWPDASWS